MFALAVKSFRTSRKDLILLIGTVLASITALAVIAGVFHLFTNQIYMPVACVLSFFALLFCWAMVEGFTNSFTGPFTKKELGLLRDFLTEYAAWRHQVNAAVKTGNIDQITLVKPSDMDIQDARRTDRVSRRLADWMQKEWELQQEQFGEKAFKLVNEKQYELVIARSARRQAEEAEKKNVEKNPKFQELQQEVAALTRKVEELQTAH